MRRRLPSIAFVVLAIPLAALATISACGGDDSKSDAGPDATTEGGKDVQLLETGPDVLDAACLPDVDLKSYLPNADASIDVDAGGIDIAACGSCFKNDCGGQIDACQLDCDCVNGVIDFVTCVGGGMQLTQCVTNALSSGNPALINLIGCAANNCVSVCVPSTADGGTDAATTDAANDATGD